MKDATKAKSYKMPPLNPKVSVGTSKSPMDYKLHQSCFLKTDIPEEKRIRVAEVNESAKSKILQTKAIWDKSTLATNPLVESRTMENFVGDRSKAFAYNFRAENLDPMRIEEPIDRPTKFHISRTTVSEASLMQSRQINDPIQLGTFRRVEEMPTNANLQDKVEWNSMTSHTTKDSDKRLVMLTSESRSHSVKISKVLTKLDYVSPCERVELYNKALRDQKTSGTFIPASKAVRKVTDRSQVKNSHAIERSTRYSTSHHSGVWELNKIENRYYLQRLIKCFALPAYCIKRSQCFQELHYGETNCVVITCDHQNSADSFFLAIFDFKTLRFLQIHVVRYWIIGVRISR